MYLVSGYDNDNDVFEDYAKVETYEEAEAIFEEYLPKLKECKLMSCCGEDIDFLAIYDQDTNERLRIEWSF